MTFQTAADRLAADIRAADAAAKAAEAAAKAAREAARAFLASSGHSRIETPSGVLSLCAGKRTVKVTCKALAAEISAMRERAIRTGRAEENVGAPYIMLR